MKCIYLNVEQQALPKVIDIEDNLKVFYKLIGCEYVDITRRKIGDKYYDIICDDEGLYKENPIISAVDNTYKPMFVGNLIISKADDEGELIDLSENDIKQILRHTIAYFTLNRNTYSALKMSY